MNMRSLTRWLAAALLAATLSPALRAQSPGPVSLFDGKTLDQFEGDPKIWRVEDGLITGGSLTEQIAKNHFLATKKSYHNFVLKLKLKLAGTGFVNSGVQIRSLRVPNNTEMSGYQVDAGAGWWGKIYDESRRNKVIGEAKDLAAVNAAVKADDWNEYQIRAEGPRIQSWVNGIAALDYIEQDTNIAQDGHIAVQVHSGGKVIVQVKDITIEELPPTPNAPTWEKVGKPGEKKGAAAGEMKMGNAPDSVAQTPEQERASFKVPDGFTVELVAAETDEVGKFIAVSWDHAGRMWTMTALDYPVDANENKAYAEGLYEKGGKDKILVYDEPYGPGPHQPRVFADGLAIPLGILPVKDGCYAQYGHDIRLYKDTNGDGKADKHDAVLTGFGIDDSHLFPHQFTQGPGNWIYLAQGAFNHGDVKRPDGKPLITGSMFSITPQASTPFHFCKLARMRPDGSDFQLLSSGPNNIWGLVLDRAGGWFIQEANDMGYPVVPFMPGTHVPGVGNEKLKPYAPVRPPSLSPPQMGGTGLSGLALKEEPGWPAAFTGEGNKRLFYVANPITGRVQVVQAAHDENGYTFEKKEDFLTSTDPWFRPIAIAFGPDGCLYVTDWYNRIISHNEVPRAHPDRDKTRGRIWRIRHKDQPKSEVPDMTKVATEDLLLYLETTSQWAQRTATEQLIQRGAKDLAPTLLTLVTDENKDAATHINALWVCEGLGIYDEATMMKMLAAKDRTERREAARALASFNLSADVLAKLFAPLREEKDSDVRSAIIQTLATVKESSPVLLEMLVQFFAPSLPADAGKVPAYEREFERYLVRAALENHGTALASFLGSKKSKSLPPENRISACLALPKGEMPYVMIEALRDAKRPINDEEAVTLLTPPVPLKAGDVTSGRYLELIPTPWLNEVAGFINAPQNRLPVLEAAVRQRDRLDRDYVTVMLSGMDMDDALQGDAKGKPNTLSVRLAAAFPVPGLEDPVGRIALDSSAPQDIRLLAIDTLPKLSAKETARLEPMATSEDTPAAVRAAAIAALASSKPDIASAQFGSLWPKLNPLERNTFASKLASSKASAKVLLDAVTAGTLKDADLDASLLERLHSVYPEDPTMKALWERVAKKFVRVLKLNGNKDGYVDSNLTLQGPFTVESWVRLDEGIDNGDGLIGNGKTLGPNFFGKKFRVFVGGDLHDVAVATKDMVPGAWTHVAFTRDDKGVFRIYLNGELDATGSKTTTASFEGCDIGRSPVGNKGTAGEFAEYRVWKVCRSAEDIRSNFDRTFAGEEKPANLMVYHSPMSDWQGITKQAAVLPLLNGPHLLSASEAKAQAEKLAKYKLIAVKPGDAKSGQTIFTSICLSCHTVAGKGANLAPALDGSAHRDLDGVLRALLTPNAAVEGGYRAFRVETKDGRLVEGFLASRDKEGLTLRMMGGLEQRINQADVAKADFTERSLMIEGLVDALSEQQVADLFSYIRTLK
jgi:putative membrane-bound dehydrogenase-like protein